MDREKLRQLLEDVRCGRIEIDQALERLRVLPYEDMGDYANLDLHRALRTGLPEVVFCQDKTTEQVLGILKGLWEHHDRVMGTRLSPEMAEAIQVELPQADYDPLSHLLTLSRSPAPACSDDAPYALVITGGTSDLPVAEEAARTLEFLGCRVERAYDVGVSGLHRLLDRQALLFGAEVVISVAGMEGALTSVVAGLVSCPVIGVPTSVGYGASFEGLAALLSMMNACAPGVAVVNIDNGFGAGRFAHLILQRSNRGGIEESQGANSG